MTTRFPNGLTTTTKTSPMGEFILPDMTKAHVYMEDFDYYTAADWTVTETGVATQVLTDADGGALFVAEGFGLAPVKNQGSGITYDSQQEGFTPKYPILTYAKGFIVLLMEAETLGGTFALTDVGGNLPVTVTAATASGGLVNSNMVVNTAGAAISATEQVRVVGVKDSGDITFPAPAGTTLIVRINESTIGGAVGV